MCTHAPFFISVSVIDNDNDNVHDSRKLKVNIPLPQKKKNYLIQVTIQTLNKNEAIQDRKSQ